MRERIASIIAVEVLELLRLNLGKSLGLVRILQIRVILAIDRRGGGRHLERAAVEANSTRRSETAEKRKSNHRHKRRHPEPR